MAESQNLMYTPAYIGTKVVRAYPCTRHNHMTDFGRKLTSGLLPPDEQGYRVYYKDGYISWSPKDVFENSYRCYENHGNDEESKNLTFGDALFFMKQGKKVSRLGWNGKGMFLWLKPETEIKSEWCKDGLLKQLADDNGGTILGLGTICMYTHDSTGRKAILTGWLASQSDMLAEDWYLVD